MSDEQRKGKMSDGRLVLCFGIANVPDAGYSVDVADHGRLYRNGVLQGYAERLRFDRDALAWSVEYAALKGTVLWERLAPEAGRR